jgi:hypothetical protein
MNATPNNHKYLRRKPTANYKQLFVFDFSFRYCTTPVMMSSYPATPS